MLKRGKRRCVEGKHKRQMTRDNRSTKLKARKTEAQTESNLRPLPLAFYGKTL